MLARAYSGHLGSGPGTLEPWLRYLAETGLNASPWDDASADRADCAVFSRNTATYTGSIDGETVLAAFLGQTRDLDATSGRAASALSIEQIAERVVRAGPRAFERIGGTFSVVVILPRRREAVLAVDRFAVENIYFTQSGNGAAFANRCELLTRHPACANTFARQAIYNYLYFHCVPGPDSGYQSIRRLLPGEYLHWRDGKLDVGAYWRAHYDEDIRGSEKSFADEVRSALSESVERHINGGRTGCFLSGGLDSSTVAGLGARCRSGDITAFCIGFDAPEYDEMGFARAAAEHFKVPLVPYYVTPADVVASLPEIVSAFDGPFGNASAVPTYYCAKLARDAGMPLVLAGDGGDELFGGNSRYAKQMLFEKYQAVPAWLRGALIEPAARAMPTALQGKMTRYIEQAAIPLPDRLMTYNLLEMIGAASFLTADFLAAVDPQGPLNSLRAMYAADGVTTLNRMLRLDLRITLADSDLPKVSHMCDLAGIPVAFPMLDERVFDLAARLPALYKIKAGQLRYFYKRAFADLLPQSTLQKTKHGFGLPFGVWLATDPMLQDLVVTNLTVLEEEHIVRRGFRDEFLQAKFQQHTGYYGTLLWVLTCLGLWIQQQRPSLR